MSAVLTPTKMTPDEYLVWEESQEERHEYIGGEVFAMTGGRIKHNRITMNTAVVLRGALGGLPCVVFVAGMRVQAAQSKAYFYPDIVVTCDPDDLGDDNAMALRHPWFIVEVLSDSTAAFDRGKKFDFYRELPSLTHYLVIEANRPHADLFCKSEQGLWVLHPLGLDDTLRIDQPHAIACPVALLFKGVAFDAPTAAITES